MAEINFNSDVIQKSYEVPVVVDFWAEWCGPCRVLGPVIEALAAEAHGKWNLVKINTEIYQEIAMKYQIRSIPAVKMFHKGEVIAEFMGALPRFQIEKWLEQHLPNPDQEGLKLILKDWDKQQAEQLADRIQNFLNEHPEIPEAKLRLALATIGIDPIKARLELDQVSLGNNPALLEAVEDVSSLLELMEANAEESQFLSETISEAQNALREWDWETAIQALIQAVMLDKNYANELPRRASIAIFRLLGHTHELSKKYQRKFDMALY